MRHKSITVSLPVGLAMLGGLVIAALSVALLAGDASDADDTDDSGDSPHLPWILQALRPQHVLALSATLNARPLSPAGSGFTYQGHLTNSGSPANGQYDLVFTLYDAPTAGNQVGTPSIITDTNQTVTDGLFTVSLDFGSSAFDGNARYLEMAVRSAGVGSYTTLSPRQPITPAPYALFALKTQGYKGVKVVAQSGGDFTSVQAALNSITDNSASNRYLLKIAAGAYTETVSMKPYVDIEGSGEGVTKITFGGSASLNTGTVVGASNAELRSLTIENTGGNADAVAIYNTSASPSLLHVTATASGATSANLGMYNLSSSSPSMKDVSATGTGGSSANGVRNSLSSSPLMTDVAAVASGGTDTIGVYNITNSSPTMIGVTALASGGTNNYGMLNNASSPKIQNSNLTGSGSPSYGIYNTAPSSAYTVLIENTVINGATNSIRNDSHFTMRVGASQLAGGPAVANSGLMTCGDTHDENNALIPGNCVNHSGNVVYVAKSGAAFTSIQAALNSITDNSSSNKYLVKISPGAYTETVTMKPFVDIEGSGEGVTKISFTGSASINTGTVIGASNAELRSLTVENTGGGQADAGWHLQQRY